MQLYYTRMQCTIGSNNQSNLIYIIAVAITIAMFIRTWLAETPGNTRPEKKTMGAFKKYIHTYSPPSPYVHPSLALLAGIDLDLRVFGTDLPVVGRPHIPPTPLPLFYFCLIFS
jgi:hypothetical protein